jgi:hypothetical protein
MVRKVKKEVTDPELLNKLNSEVTDPNLLSQLEGMPAPEKQQGFFKNVADYEMGLFPGIAHGLSDIGANVAQGLHYPFIKGYEAWTGKKSDYKVPRADFNRYAPESTAGQFGKDVGNFISPFAIPVAGSEAFVAKGASPSMRAAQTVVPGGIIGGLEADPDNSLLGTTLGAAGSAIPMAMRGVKDAYNWMTRPSESLKNLKEYETKLLESLSRITGKGEQFEQKATEKAGGILPQEHFVDTAKALSEAFGGSKKKLNSYFEKSYGEYGQGKIGQKPIKNPYELHELHNQMSDIAGVPRSTIKEAEGISPKIKFSNILDEAGNPYEIEVPAKNSKLQDYIRFMRETRDASGLAFKKAKSQNLTQGEKESLLDTGRKLQKVSQDATSRVEGTMTPEEAKKFAKINKVYETVGAPIKYNPTFAKAWRSDTKLGKISDSFYRELLQPENEAVRKYLFGSQDFKKALLGHVTEGKKNPLTGQDFDKKIAKINSLLHDKVTSGLLKAEEKQKLEHIVYMANRYKNAIGRMNKKTTKIGRERKNYEEQLSTRTKLVGGAAAGTLGAQGLKYLIGKIFTAHND